MFSSRKKPFLCSKIVFLYYACCDEMSQPKRNAYSYIQIFLEDVRRLAYYTTLVKVKNVIRTDEKEEVLHSLLRVLPGTHATIENKIDGSKQASTQGSTKLITGWQSIFFLIEDS